MVVESARSDYLTGEKNGSRLTSIERNNVIVCLILTLGSLIYKSYSITLGVFFGGVMVILNFWLLRRIIERGFAQTSKVRPAFLLSYFFKFAVLAVIIFILINCRVVNIPALAVGLSTLFVGIVADQFVQILKK